MMEYYMQIGLWNPSLCKFPDLVIEQVLSHLPTKAAVRLRFLSKQWEGTLSSASTLDFDEADDDWDSNELKERHSVFIKTLDKLLLEEKENKEHKLQVLDKFRLWMTSFTTKDNRFVTNWLRHCFARSVKVVDISTKDIGLASRGWPKSILRYGGFNRNNLSECCNLKHIDIRSRSMTDFVLRGCNNEVNGTINCRSLSYFSFEGCLTLKFSLRTSHLQDTCVRLKDNVSDGNQFAELIDFLKQYGISTDMELSLQDFKYIPVELVRGLRLQMREQKLKLMDPLNRSWTLQLKPFDGCILITSGWHYCCTKNQIEEGHTVVFEFMTEYIKLHIFRAKACDVTITGPNVVA